MNSHNSRWRLGTISAWGSLIVAVVCTMIADFPMEVFGRSAIRELSGPLLQDLAIVSGISDDAGRLDRDQSLEVEVIQEGGSAWIREEFLKSIETSRYFDAGPSPHIVHIEAVELENRLRVRLKLWRNGWEVLSDQLIDVFTTPWIAAAVLGGAGILAQTVLGAWWSLLICGFAGEAWFAYQSEQFWSRGPIFLWLSDMRVLSSESSEIWLVALAIMLSLTAIYLHFRSKQRQSSSSWWQLALWVAASSLGVAAWLDVSFRSSYIYAIDSWPGRCSMLGIFVVWCAPWLERVIDRIRSKRVHR